MISKRQLKCFWLMVFQVMIDNMAKSMRKSKCDGRTFQMRAVETLSVSGFPQYLESSQLANMTERLTDVIFLMAHCCESQKYTVKNVSLF